MAVGRISTSVLTDIGNAIRRQAGVSTTYRPGDMSAAVSALDGTDAGEFEELPYAEVEDGILSDTVLRGIADAIRGQNGTDTRYRPEEMASAILALRWETERVARAMLLADGTLEFNYRVGEESALGDVVRSWEVDPGGYGSDVARPWHDVRAQVRRVVFDAGFRDAGITNYSYWCMAMGGLCEVVGFEEVSGATDVRQMFTNCGNLATIWATSFDNGVIASFTSFLYGCNRLVGQTGVVATSNSGKDALSIGESGVLTSPGGDMREWAFGHLYDTGELEITGSEAPDPMRGLVVSGRVCVNARYQLGSALPWYCHRDLLRTCTFREDVGVDIASMDNWFQGCAALTGIIGWEGVHGLRSMRQTFNGCTALQSLGLMGLDPSGITDWFYAFAGCRNLRTIVVDPTWELAEGASGFGTFHGCTSLVGGNGTAYDSGAIGCSRMVVDRAGRAGYLTEDE